MEMEKLAAYVAVEAATYAIDKPYEYLIPDKLRADVVPGVRVRVGFGRGNRKTEGIVLGVHPFRFDKQKLKSITEVLDTSPVLDDNLLSLALRLRDQCFCTLFDVAKVMLPSGVWHKFEIVYTAAEGVSPNDAERIAGKYESGKEIADLIFSAKQPVKKSELLALFDKAAVEKVVSLLVSSGVVTTSEYIIQKISDKTERLVRIGVSKEKISEYISLKKPKASVVEALDMLLTLRAVSVKDLTYFTGVSVSQLNTLKKNGIVYFESSEIYRRPRPTLANGRREIVLNKQQEAVFRGVSSHFGKSAACSLLYGVTGSGKTLVYFKLIERVISLGKTAILLVPEISLTPQLLEQVYSYFGERTAVMHSALSVGERYDEWKRIKRGEVDVVVGTRSAVFSPLKNIGIIILDEEQEDTYKSSQSPRYHARDVAKYRCVADGAHLLLGSATPSVESMYFAKEGKYNLYTLTERFNEQPLPQVIVSDLRKSLRSGNDKVIGRELYEELSKNIQAGEQSILFLNRRGASKYVVCDDCAEVAQCPNCSVPLVYHSKNGRLMCHHCGHSEKVSDRCIQCGGRLRFVGFGTQRVESELSELFPGVEVVRMDMDTTSAKASHEKLLNKFRDEKIPILLGTQMITKGLDFENVTLVGVLSADQAIFNENYKAAENAFSLITQVVGRSGRGKKTGRAVIQTYSPKNALIEAAAKQDFDKFYENEIILRKARGLPPFSDFFTLAVVAESELDAYNSALKVSEKLKTALSVDYTDIKARVLGPTPTAIVKLNNKFRYKVSICTENNRRLRDMVSRVIRDFMKDKQNKGQSIIPDINTTDF
ncbi:MAG: primosomal protein N' [Oscillospiraceae bacterium]|nr:primosomal protein N' [Oscillospiraceae bacterium]